MVFPVIYSPQRAQRSLRSLWKVTNEPRETFRKLNHFEVTVDFDRTLDDLLSHLIHVHLRVPAISGVNRSGPLQRQGAENLERVVVPRHDDQSAAVRMLQ